MAATYEQHVTVHRECYEEILKRCEVTAVDVNYRKRNGELTEELCIQVWVKKKKPQAILTEEEILPTIINGCLVDVVEGEMIPLHLHPVSSSFDKAASGSLQGGDSIGVGTGYYSGTVGYFVKKNSELGIITCAHVAEKVGNMMVSPSIEDGGKSPANDIGKAVTVKDNQTIDGAYIKLDKKVSKYQLKNGATIAGSAAAAVGDSCKFYGRSSTESTGKVTSINFSAKIDGKTYKNQILYEGTTKGGDSGSLVYKSSGTNKGIGMIFAATTDNKLGLANPIADVLRDLGGLTIAT